jgi:signal transduction histidine kinase
MLRVVACVYDQHNLWLLGVAAVVCVFSWVGALLLLSRIETAAPHRRHTWLALAGATAGGGVWATHFISMLAFNPGLPVGFSLPVTLLSAVFGVGGVWASFELRRILSGNIGAISAGGLLAVSVVGLHFIGMAGVEAPAQKVWAADLVIASVLLAAAFAISGFVTLQQATTLRLRAVACGLFVCVVISLHFTAMGALSFVPDPRLPEPAGVLDRTGLAITVTFGAVALVLLSGVAALADRRIVQERMLRAVEADRAKSRFIATMSHELRTPLNAIIGYAELIAESSQEEFTVIDAAKVQVSARQLLVLVNDMLDLAKIEANRLPIRTSECSISQLVRDTCKGAEEQVAAQRNTLLLSMEPDLPLVVGDPMRIKQCLLNLLTNAAKFTEDGYIRVRVHMVDGAVEISVSDTGIGMTEEQQQRLFTPFGADDSIARIHSGGAGLGLSLTKKLLQLMGGSIAVQSAPGKGSTFAISLPTAAAPAMDAPFAAGVAVAT